MVFFEMIEAIFYFQVLFLLAFLVVAVKFRSPSFFLMAFVLSMITAISLGGEGIDYFDRWEYDGLNAGGPTISATPFYVKETVGSSAMVSAWHYGLFASGFVWLVFALVLGVKGRDVNAIKSL